MIIREMEPREIDLVINLFQHYAEQALIADIDDDRLLATIKQYCIRPNLFFNIACWGQRPVGVIGGFLSEDPVEPEVTATIQFNYLLPDYATVDNYSLLIERFRAWSQQFNCRQMRAIDIGTNMHRLTEVYQQLGFDPVTVSIMNKEMA